MYSQKNNLQMEQLYSYLWTLIILAHNYFICISEVSIEGMLISRKKKQFHAEMLARSGIDYAKSIIEQNHRAREALKLNQWMRIQTDLYQSALYVKRGLPTTSTITLTNTELFQLQLNLLKMEEILIC